MRLMPLICLGLSGVAGLAQGVFKNANSPTDALCPRILQDKTSLNFGSAVTGTTGGQMGADASHQLYYQQGEHLFPQGQRKSVATFAAYDQTGKATPISSLKGKVVLVGLWSVNCAPSAKMLMELASLYPKREKFGFEILAVNFDENQQDGGGIAGGWRAINSFVVKNKSFFKASQMPVFTPGLGKEGPSNFMDMIYSLPVLFVVDREGNYAQVHIGYKEGFVGEAIKRAVLEKPLAAVLPAPAKP